jgi:dihydrofolate reductase
LPLAIVVAVAKNGVIGKDGGLPWRIPEDLRWFRRVTVGHAVIMGRKTWESLGKPLKERRNVVVSESLARGADRATAAGAAATHAEFASTLAEALRLARRGGDAEPRVIGGARLYAEALPLATRLFWTDVLHDAEGDVRFPAVDWTEWYEVERHAAEAEGVVWRVLERVEPGHARAARDAGAGSAPDPASLSRPP